MANIQALIFAKYPQPGRVKTRMTPPLTPEQAAGIHCASLLAVCERINALTDVETILVVTPDEQLDKFKKIVPDNVDDYWTQGAGDLGERLTRAVDRAFSQDADAVILLGADSPTTPNEIFLQTIGLLSKHDAVLGPCEDGGYYLLALSKPLPALFQNIDWGSENVADQTRARAADGAIDLSELKTWYDLDRYEDLVRAQRDLQSVSKDVLPHTFALKERIDELTS